MPITQKLIPCYNYPMLPLSLEQGGFVGETIVNRRKYSQILQCQKMVTLFTPVLLTAVSKISFWEWKNNIEKEVKVRISIYLRVCLLRYINGWTHR